MRKMLIVVGMLMTILSSGQETFTTLISSGKNDAEQNVASVNLYNTTLTFGYKDNRLRYTALRFEDIQVPKGSEIDSAYIQFRAAENSVTDTRSFFIYCDDTTYSLPLTEDDNNITDRIHTDAVALWEPGPWQELDNGTAQKTADLSEVITEITNEAGWKAGNPMTFILVGSSSTEGYVTAMAYDEIGITFAPTLRINYHEPTGINEIEEISNWMVYPNPSEGKFTVKIESRSNERCQLVLTDLLGKEVAELFDGYLEKGTNTLNYNLKNNITDKGLYFMVLKSGKKRSAKKLVIR